MGVHINDAGRGDFCLHRHGQEKLGLRWQQQIDGNLVPVDLSTWVCELSFYDTSGKKLSTPHQDTAHPGTSDGYFTCYIDIPDSWENVTNGTYEIIGFPSQEPSQRPTGSGHMLATGDFTIV